MSVRNHRTSSPVCHGVDVSFFAADSSDSCIHRYETAKADWQRRHPNATPAEYQAAMTALARLLGV